MTIAPRSGKFRLVRQRTPQGGLYGRVLETAWYGSIALRSANFRTEAAVEGVAVMILVLRHCQYDAAMFLWGHSNLRIWKTQSWDAPSCRWYGTTSAKMTTLVIGLLPRWTSLVGSVSGDKVRSRLLT